MRNKSRDRFGQFAESKDKKFKLNFEEVYFVKEAILAAIQADLRVLHANSPDEAYGQRLRQRYYHLNKALNRLIWPTK